MCDAAAANREGGGALHGLWDNSRYSDGLRIRCPGFDSQQGKEVFLYAIASIPDLGPTHPRIQWVPGAPFPGLRGRGVKLTTELKSSAEVKSGGALPPLPAVLNGTLYSFAYSLMLLPIPQIT
jgi:hypothetical protein